MKKGLVGTIGILALILLIALPLQGCGSSGSTSSGYYGGDSGGGGTTAPQVQSSSNVTNPGQPLSPGNMLQINGQGFGSTQGTSYVQFTSSTGTNVNSDLYTQWTDTQIVCRVPEGIVRTTVTWTFIVFVSGQGSNSSNINGNPNQSPTPSPSVSPSPSPQPGAPVLTQVNPNTGTVGTTVTLIGQNLGTGGTITVGGLAVPPSSIVWNGPTSITLAIPDGATGIVAIVVSPTGASSTASINFTIIGGGAGAQWWPLTTPSPGAYGGGVQVKMANGTPYVAYCNGTYIFVGSYSNSAWSPLPVPTTYYHGNFSLYMDGSTPYVAAYNGSGSYIDIIRYTGGGWSVIGTTGMYGINPSLYVHGEVPTPYVAYENGGEAVYVGSFPNLSSTMAPMGAPFYPGYKPALNGVSGTPYLAYQDGSSRIQVARWNGPSGSEQWTSYGMAPDSGDFAPRLYVDGSTPYLAYSNYDGQVHVATYNEGWHDLSGGGIPTYNGVYDFAVGGGIPYVARVVQAQSPVVDQLSRDDGGTYDYQVSKLQGAWMQVGNFNSKGNSWNFGISIDLSGSTPYAACIDDTSNVVLKKYSTTKDFAAFTQNGLLCCFMPAFSMLQ
jgi:hypothetical protein